MEHASYPHDSSFTPSLRPILIVAAIIFGFTSVGLGVRLLTSSTTQDQSTLPTFDPKKTIVVDVAGAVQSPGVQRHVVGFDQSLRISDVIASAGGLTAQADTQYLAKTMNQAAIVTDGQKIFIPTLGEQPDLQSQVDTTVNLNTATLEQLEQLPGIGETRAKRIIDSRPIQTLDELSTKAQIPQSVTEKLHDLVTF